MPYTTILGGDMNKQIQDLFMRSGGSIAMIDGAMLTFTDHFDPEEFAKLIVRECADIASINQYQPYSAGHYVLKHFGFEK